VSGHISSNKTK